MPLIPMPTPPTSHTKSAFVDPVKKEIEDPSPAAQSREFLSLLPYPLISLFPVSSFYNNYPYLYAYGGANPSTVATFSNGEQHSLASEFYQFPYPSPYQFYGNFYGTDATTGVIQNP